MKTSTPPATLLSRPSGDLRDSLVRWFEDRGEPSFRADQVLDWVLTKRVLDPEGMTNLPADLRWDLARELPPGCLERVAVDEAPDGTVKYLWRRTSGGTFESVRIPTSDRITLCLSSQVGCALGCTFCATGYMGFEENLPAGEMVEQVLRMLEGEPENESVNLVFMGMGEPFLNTEAVLEAVRILNEHADIGARRITISTAGIVPGIDALAEFPLQVRLAVSLHAPTDGLRDRIMPINKKWPLAELMAACRRYHDATGRHISFEYTQLPGLNDGPEQVAGLVRLLGDLPAKINVIPYNPVEGADFRVPTAEETDRFVELLRGSLRQGVSVRRNRGNKITAACGQLRTRGSDPVPGRLGPD